MSNAGGGGWSTTGSSHSTQLVMRAYRFDQSLRGEHPRRWRTGTVSRQAILDTCLRRQAVPYEALYRRSGR